MQKLHILVGGASGAVGEGLVEEFLKQGHYVTAILRGKDKKENLQKVIGERNLHEAKLDFIINSFHSEEEIGMLREEVKALAPVDMAIASLGGWFHGEELYNISLQDWHTVLTNSLTSHFSFSKAILPLLEEQEKGMYVMINGGAAEYAVPHSGVISVVAAAQKMMSHVLQSELKNKNVQVYGVGAFDLVRTKLRKNASNLWLGPEEIAQYILDLKVSEGEKVKQYWHKLERPADLLV